MSSLREVAEFLHVIVWGPWTLVLFLGVGLLYTVKSRGFQIWGAGRWWSATVGSLGRDAEENEAEGKDAPGKDAPGKNVPGKDAPRRDAPGSGVTPFQSACTALAATVGTGNIVGVATALTCGGAGALFWMWLSAVIGMMSAYAETWLGQMYRYRRPDGHWMCGPMVYMERGLKCPSLGTIYAALALLASLGMGSMVQSNSVSTTLHYNTGFPEWVSGIVVTGLAAAVILGGIGRISQVAEKLMPVSAAVYVALSMTVILSCLPEIPGILSDVLREAFRPQAAAGGISGFLLSSSVRYGLSRGVFSNEAGLGSLAVLHGAAENTTPEEQGMWAMFEVFFDTIVICTLTALVILCIGRVCGLPEGMDGAALASWCFSRRLGIAGEVLVPASMVVFAFATIIAWYYMGRQNAGYLAEKLGDGGKYRRSTGGTARKGGTARQETWEAFYLALYLAAVFVGCVCRLDVVWLVSDLWNGLMAYPNLLALILLSRQVRMPRKGTP